MAMTVAIFILICILGIAITGLIVGWQSEKEMSPDDIADSITIIDEE